MARETKLTPKIAAAIVKHIAAGVPRKHAAAAEGIVEDTIYKWMRRGRKGTALDDPYVKFFYAMKKADAQSVIRRVKRIEQAGKDGTWQADAWHLERVHDKEFAGNKREIKELREQLAALIKAVESGKLATADPKVKEDTA